MRIPEDLARDGGSKGDTMLRSFRLRVVLVSGVATLAVLGFASTSSAISTGSRCWVTGGGTLHGDGSLATPLDSFGGHASSFKDGNFEGTWTHVTSDGRKFQGDVDILGCTRNGGDPEHPEVQFSIAVFSGTGTFDGQEVIFAGTVEDDGEPGAGNDTYSIAIGDAPNGNFLYQTNGRIVSGNIQVHPANPGHP